MPSHFNWPLLSIYSVLALKSAEVFLFKVAFCTQILFVAVRATGSASGTPAAFVNEVGASTEIIILTSYVEGIAGLHPERSCHFALQLSARASQTSRPSYPCLVITAAT